MNEYELFEKYLSAPRIERYLLATKSNKQSCIYLYKSNLNVSKAFHPILGLFEVILRNKINQTLSRYFNDPDWIIHQQKGFMIDSSLDYINASGLKVETNRFIFNSVKTSEQKLLKRNISINANRLIAEQSMSFWTELFEKKYYKILKGRPIKIFEKLPNNIGRVDILKSLNKIRRFRNRINHNEPICFVGSNIALTIPIETLEAIYTLLKCINPETLKLFEEFNDVENQIRKLVKENK
jgi:hypothetical protein